MERAMKVLLFAASLRRDSLNVRLASLIQRVLSARDVQVDHGPMLDFDCPSYDGDAEGRGIPAGAQRLRDRLIACDAVMIASPEYNGSMPGLLKNLIDWTSRFRPQPFNG